MTSWVYNRITLLNELNEEQVKLLGQIKEKGLCEYLLPTPKELGGEEKDDWQIDNWGAKWGDCETKIEEDAIEFETAWGALSEMITDRFAEIFPNFEYCCEEESGYGEEYLYKNGKGTLVKEWDAPEVSKNWAIERDGDFLTRVLLLEEKYKDMKVGYFDLFVEEELYIGTTKEEVEEYLKEHYDGAEIDWEKYEEE